MTSASQQVTNPPTLYVAFALAPYFQAVGSAGDKWTGQSISGAALQLTAVSGLISNQTVATNWQSQSDGSFPSDLTLAGVDWSMVISKAGYSNRVVRIGGSRMAAGGVTNVGEAWLIPLDTKGNGIADNWAVAHFGTMTVDPLADPDGDGLNNRQEYLAGTDPTNAASVLKVQNEWPTPAGMTLSWPVANGRTYQVRVTDNLTVNPWPLTFGPWTARPSDTNMQWTDTNALICTNRFYRIKLQAP